MGTLGRAASSFALAFVAARTVACSAFGEATTETADGGAADADPTVDADSTGDASDASSAADGTASPSCNPTAPFGTPAPVPELSSADTEPSARLSADGLEVFVTRVDASGGKLLRGARTSLIQPFGTLTPLSLGAGEQRHGSLTDDGKTLVFAQELPAKQIARSTRTGPETFGPPLTVALGAGQLFEPWISGDGLTLYFVVDEGSGNKIHVARRDATNVPFGARSPIPELDLTGDEGLPMVTDDQLTIYFFAQGQGQDIFVATRPTATSSWGTPARDQELSSAANDRPSWISKDGCTIYLASDRTGAGVAGLNIWRAERPR